jgi:predicted Fe-Mo cluster-binding NifX family protein
MRIAIPTKAYAGLEDSVSEAFGKAKTFTIVDVEDDRVENVKVIDNPAASYEHGAGPVAVKTLVDLEVNLVMGVEFGPGASSLLVQHNIQRLPVKANLKVADSIKEAQTKLRIEDFSQTKLNTLNSAR